MNTENSKTNEPHRFKFPLVDKLDLKDSNRNMTLANLSIYYTQKNIKSLYNNNKFKNSPPSWNDEFDLPDGTFSIADIQDYIEFIIKNIGLQLKILLYKFYSKKIKNKILFKVKTGYKLELLSSETMKLLGCVKKDVDQDKDGEDVPKLKSFEVL